MSFKAFPIDLIILELIFACLFWCSLLSHAYQFNIGGREGWTTNPTENYNHWAERMRFQVNDTLFFKYNKEADTVLLVNKDDYETCQTDKPIQTLDKGNSVFRFHNSGPFYFISGDKENCAQGQKLIIVVLAIRNKRIPPPKAQPPARQIDAPPPPPPESTPPPSDYNSTATPEPKNSSSISLFNYSSVTLVVMVLVSFMNIMGFGGVLI